MPLSVSHSTQVPSSVFQVLHSLRCSLPRFAVVIVGRKEKIGMIINTIEVFVQWNLCFKNELGYHIAASKPIPIVSTDNRQGVEFIFQARTKVIQMFVNVH